MKYIFVTGGVVSSLGKGLTAAALGTLLDNRAETDLDLGHYERFTNTKLSRMNNLTSGQVYQTVLNNEREGKYLGKTVQVIPHVTDEIQHRIHQIAEQSKSDVLITEIGGTTGDIEGLPFLEAIREFALEAGHGNVLFIHVTYVPFIKAAGELKTKPTQQSVAKLREIGITPDMLVCRCEYPLDKDLRQKISMFCNVPYEAVIEEKDVEHSIYEVPLMLQRERMDDLVCSYLHLEVPQADMSHWQDVIRKLIAPQHRVRIGVVGKYIELQDAYKSVYEAIIHGGVANDCGVEIEKIESEEIERFGAEKVLKGLGGVLVPGGFGERGIEGKVQAARYCRERKLPYLGLCLGMQIACIEFARHVLKLEKAHSTEFDPDTPHPVIALLDAQKKVSKKGGTMRLGAQPCQLVVGSQAARLYGAFVVNERHRHRYEFNNAYRTKFEEGGIVFSGTSPDGKLVEIIEIRDHPFFLASQFHPEFQSKPNKPHPLFKGFIAACHHYIHHRPL